jgi:hypothetical protein
VHSDIENLASTENLDLGALREACKLSLKDVKDVKSSLEKKFPIVPGRLPEVDLVLLGSYGRQEATKGSDFDHLILLHASPTPVQVRDFIAEVDTIRNELDIPKPGTSGLFGEIAISAELYIRIGLEADSNANTTRRLLLLTESVSAYSDQAHQDLLTKIIDRYCADYDEVEAGQDPSRVPHFLLNDLVRYWRTITVDFGAKKWRALTQNWHVRYAKLLTSRKLMFASSLASIFLAPSAVESGKTVKDHLFEEFQKPVLARLAGLYDRIDQPGKKALRDIFESYNRFIKILDEHGGSGRDFMETLEPAAAEIIRAEMKVIGIKIQDALELIFYEEHLFSALTKRYGLF